MTSKNINYIGKLDHLRFFAAALVGIYHLYFFQSPLWSGFQDPHVKVKKVFSAFVIEGHTGVALFLVLSGFIFAAIGYGRKIHYGSFVMNRVLRIVPLFATAIFIAAILSGADFQKIFSTVFFPLPSSDVISETHVSPHLWTIRVEFLFYLLFPFLITFVSKYGFRYIGGLLLLLVTIRTMLWWGVSHRMLPEATIAPAMMKFVSYQTLLGRLDQFAIGMVAGAIYSGRAKWKVPSWLQRPWWPVITFMLPLLAVYWFHRMGGYSHLKESHWMWIVWPDVEALAWCAFALSYVSCTIDWPRPVSRLFSWLGTLSFSLYVNHWLFVHDFPVARYVPLISSSLTTNAALVFLFIVLPVLALFSWLTYAVIELPFFSLRKTYIEKDKPLEAAAVAEKA